MGKYAENQKLKSECDYAKELKCACAFCQRKRGCFNCIECKVNGEREIVNECDMQILEGY